jgi:hypothetical protein
MQRTAVVAASEAAGVAASAALAAASATSNHSITPSARASTVAGMSRPSAFAVLRLIIS